MGWLIPVNAYDDGRFTYLKPPNSPEYKTGIFPAVFGRETEYGEDFVVNTTVEGNTLIVHGPTRTWSSPRRLRRRPAKEREEMSQQNTPETTRTMDATRARARTVQGCRGRAVESLLRHGPGRAGAGSGRGRAAAALGRRAAAEPEGAAVPRWHRCCWWPWASCCSARARMTRTLHRRCRKSRVCPRRRCRTLCRRIRFRLRRCSPLTRFRCCAAAVRLLAQNRPSA